MDRSSGKFGDDAGPASDALAIAFDVVFLVGTVHAVGVACEADQQAVDSQMGLEGLDHGDRCAAADQRVLASSGGGRDAALTAFFCDSYNQTLAGWSVRGA